MRSPPPPLAFLAISFFLSLTKKGPWLKKLTKLFLIPSDALEKTIADNIDSFLLKHGYSSFGDLEVEIQAVANSDALQQWDEIKNTIDITNAIDRAIFMFEGIAFAAGVPTIGALALAGVISGPAGWAALGAMGMASAVIMIVHVVASAITGKIVQERLKDAVEDLFHARADAHLQVNRIRLLNDFMSHMGEFFSLLPPFLSSILGLICSESLIHFRFTLPT